MKVSLFHLMPFTDLPEDPPHGPNWKEAGVWVDVPRSLYDPVVGNELYNEYLDEMEFAETVGFDGVCVNEHHQNIYGTMPSPNIMLATLARRTSRVNLIVLGTSIALYNPPIRIAEEMAMLDVISGGRVICGFPVGSSQDTNWCYGVGPAQLRERYYEAEELITRSWETDAPFPFNGKYTQLRYVNPWPRPLQQPRPPIWVPGGGSVETWDWTIQKDYVYAALSYGGFKRAQQTLDGYWERVRELGAELNPYRVAFLQLALVSESAAQAKEDYGEAVEFFYQRLLGSTGRYFPEAPGYRTERSIRAGFERSAALPPSPATGGGAQRTEGPGPTWEDLIEGGNIIVGDPDQVASQVREAMTELRVGQLLPLLQIGSMRRDAAMKNIELFGTEVIPQLRGMWSEWEDHWSPQPLETRVAPHPTRNGG